MPTAKSVGFVGNEANLVDRESGQQESGQVTVALAGVARELSLLESLVEDLTGRLGPVLSPEAPAPAKSLDQTSGAYGYREAPCLLVVQLADVRSRIEGTAARVADIRCRLQL